MMKPSWYRQLRTQTEKPHLMYLQYANSNDEADGEIVSACLFDRKYKEGYE